MYWIIKFLNETSSFILILRYLVPWRYYSGHDNQQTAGGDEIQGGDTQSSEPNKFSYDWSAVNEHITWFYATI